MKFWKRKKKCCKNCKYGVEDNSPASLKYILCKRFPAQAVCSAETKFERVIDIKYDFKYPLNSPDECCGEFKRKGKS